MGTRSKAPASHVEGSGKAAGGVCHPSASADCPTKAIAIAVAVIITFWVFILLLRFFYHFLLHSLFLNNVTFVTYALYYKIVSISREYPRLLHADLGHEP